MTLEQAINQAKTISKAQSNPIWVVKHKISQEYHTFSNIDWFDDELHSCYINGVCVTTKALLDEAFGGA